MTVHPSTPAALLGQALEEARLATAHEASEAAAAVRALPWVERQGYVIYMKEAAFLARWAAVGAPELADDDRYRTVLIEAMRMGPSTTLGKLAESTGVPRGTLSSWQSRNRSFGAALELLREGPAVVIAQVEAGAWDWATAIQATDDWPEPRTLHGPHPHLTPAESERIDRESDAERALAGLPVHKPPADVPEEWSPEEIAAVYAVADRHWTCPQPCRGPHLEGEEAALELFNPEAWGLARTG